MKPPGITNPHQSDPHKRCEAKPKCPGLDTTLYIRQDKIIRLCPGCVLSTDEVLNKAPRFERRRVLPDHNRKVPKSTT